MSKSSSCFSGNVLKLFLGSLFAQALGVLITPIVTRLFAPEAFGVAAIFVSITGIVGVVACLRYELSIMLPKTDEEAANLLAVSLFFILITTGIIALIIFLAGDGIANLLHSPEIKKYLWLIPVSIFGSSTFLALTYWASRTNYFGYLSFARVISSIVTQTTKLGMGLSGFVCGGTLIVATILGQIISTIILGGQIWRTNHNLFKASIHWKKMFAGLKRHKNFPIYSTSSALLNTASQLIPVILLALYFSPKIVGFFALGKMVLGMPINLIGRSIGQVFFQKASEAHNHTGNLSVVVEETIKRLVALGIFPLLLIVLIGKDIFTIVFGTQWAEAGIYMQIMGLWVFFQFISSPISTMFCIFEKQNQSLFFNGALFLARTVSIIIGGMTGNIMFTLFLFAGTGIVCYGFLFFWTITMAGIPVTRGLSCIFQYSLYSSPLLIIIAITKWLLGVQEMGVFIFGLCCVFVYYIFVISQDAELRKMAELFYRRVIGFAK